MPTSLDHIHPETPMGANLIADGATFRVWASHAHSLHVLGDFNDRQRYMFYVVGEGSEGRSRILR